MSISRFFSAVLLSVCAIQSAHAGDTKWINGKWFDGIGFVETTFYSVGGRLTTTAPDGHTDVVNLAGGYVVPAFGDAHHHGIDREDGLDQKVAAFLHDGVFYVKNPNVVPDLLTPAMRKRLNIPTSVDVVFANGGLTSSGGHPGPLHDKLAARGVFPGLEAKDMEGRAYFTIDSEAQLAEKWPAILAGKPDFIKTFRNGLEDLLPHEKGQRPAHGLEPEVLRAVVRRAHAANLRVSTHVDTARDVAIAIDAGVDELNHMPIPEAHETSDFDAFLIDPAVAAEAARQGTFVVLTASVGPRLGANRWTEDMKARVVENERTNIQVLLAAGVRLAIGSDGISGETPFVTGKDEIDYLRRHQLVDNLSLLKMWAENTPATIFPDRKIGRLKEGYEANFLVLEGNPVVDAENLGRIAMRVKAGELIAPEQAPVSEGTTP